MERISFPLAGTELYRPLNPLLQQIRLLTILPGNFHDEVRCMMNVASLNHEVIHRQRYETISYVWGDPGLRGSIRVNGETVNVPQSSIAALRRMRLTDVERVVWIDAICINQGDNSEKSSQVALMSDIYERGDHNLIFLGDDEEDVAEEVQFVLESEVLQLPWAKCFREADDERRKGAIPVLGRGDIPESLIALCTVLYYDGDLLDQLYNLPWFRRLWVLQEAVLSPASTCFWGEAKFRLISVLVAAKISHSRLMRRQVDGLLTAVMIFNERMMSVFGSGRKTFMGTAYMGELLEVTDSRDRVFAHISRFRKGALRAAMSPLIAPDYSKTTQQVYRDATRHALEISDCDEDGIWEFIKILSERDLEGRTTWAIQFGRNNPREGRWIPEILDFGRFLAGVKNENKDQHKTCPRKLTMLRHNIADPNILTLYVAVVDSALETTAVLSSDRDFVSVLNLIRSVHAMTTFEHEATALVLAAGGLFIRSDRSFRDVPHLLEGYRAFMRYEPFHHMDLAFRLLERHDQKDWYWYWLSFLRAARYRRFFKTAIGLVGCGPHVMRKGDVLVVPENAQLPLVLRPVGEQYLYIGTAYVHGLMHGEVFDMDVEWKWVEIR